MVRAAKRPEEVPDVHEHIWGDVNAHLGTDAHSTPELIEQLGIMRFGHRPRVADTFCGSGQIPFEAARLGCDVYASDLSPVACMLTWGAFHIVGAPPDRRGRLRTSLESLVARVQEQIDELGVETDGRGWRAKVFLCCLEARCPQTGWMVPLLPTLVVSKGYGVIAELVPDQEHKRYEVAIRSGVTDEQLTAAERGTVRSDGRGQEPYLIHTVHGQEYRTKISTLRGDYRAPDGATSNRLRQWEKHDFKPRDDDIFQERPIAFSGSVGGSVAEATNTSSERSQRTTTTASASSRSSWLNISSNGRRTDGCPTCASSQVRRPMSQFGRVGGRTGITLDSTPTTDSRTGTTEHHQCRRGRPVCCDARQLQ